MHAAIDALALVRRLSWPEWRHHPLRHLTALVAVALGVALAYAVHVINASALSEFSAAVRAINGQPDFELRGQRQGFDEALYARVAAHPQVAVASPVIEIDTLAVDADGARTGLRVLGLDALVAGALSPALVPRPVEGAALTTTLDPDALFLNGAARSRFGSPTSLQVQMGSALVTLPVRGSVAAGGAPLAVIDIAGAQAHFGWLGRLSRIDVRLAPGADRDAVIAAIDLPAGVRVAAPDEAAVRVSNLSRAYRVNLTVLALVALFTGAFLVFSVQALSVSQRQQQFALLGVLGLSSRERMALVLGESAAIGIAGSVAGIALGLLLAAAALRWLAGDLGGGYFPGVAPTLQVGAASAAAYGAAGIAAALAGGWLPAHLAQRMAPAQALKGLGDGDARRNAGWPGLVVLTLGGLLALLPPVGGIPLAAYLAVACVLVGGIACVPAAIAALLRLLPPPRDARALLATQRALDQRHHATIAVAGVVASLSLAVALTVMVTSFRTSVTDWLDTVLPAELYVRTANATATSDTAFLPQGLVDDLRDVRGIERIAPQRVVSLMLDPVHPAIALIARPVGDPATSLPLVGELSPADATLPAAYVSEAMVSLHGASPGGTLDLPMPDGRTARFRVRGVWRDYARQHGAVTIDIADFRRLTGDTRVNDVALWLSDDADMTTVQAAIRALAPERDLIQFATPGEIRAVSLAIFDRSFAVTYWLQAVAIGIGLFGIAASFSAQVLARRKEFGLMAHLGFTRRDVLAIVAAEGAVWTTAGALLGTTLGLGVSVVLVHVVNPQSFHWTMEFVVPWIRLAALFTAVVGAGMLTAWLAGRKAAGRDPALAVKEDW